MTIEVGHKNNKKKTNLKKYHKSYGSAAIQVVVVAAKKCLKIPKGYSEAVYKRAENKMATRKRATGQSRGR